MGALYFEYQAACGEIEKIRRFVVKPQLRRVVDLYHLLSALTSVHGVAPP